MAPSEGAAMFLGLSTWRILWCRKWRSPKALLPLVQTLLATFDSLTTQILYFCVLGCSPTWCETTEIRSAHFDFGCAELCVQRCNESMKDFQIQLCRFSGEGSTSKWLKFGRWILVVEIGCVQQGARDDVRWRRGFGDPQRGKERAN